MEKTFAEALRLRCGLGRGAHVLAAVSGGADSTALLHLLHGCSGTFGVRLTVAHFNHGQRGRMAAGDEVFVKCLAKNLGLPFRSGRLRVKSKTLNEEALREARLAFLAKAARRVKADAVALGHTMDDVAETLLLRLIRGAGAEGLAVMPPRSEMEDMAFVRPLLEFRRRELRAWLRARRFPWREDASNRDERFVRNRLRRRVMPVLLKRFNPAAVEALARTAELLREENACLQAHAEKLLSKDGTLSVKKLKSAPLALRRRAMRLLLASAMGSLRGLSFEHVESALGLLESGVEIHLPGWWTLRRQGGKLMLVRDANRKTSRRR